MARILAGCGAVAERPIAIEVGDVPLTATPARRRPGAALSAWTWTKQTLVDPQGVDWLYTTEQALGVVRGCFPV